MIINHKGDYREKRRQAYPPIGDQLDAIYKLALSLEGVAPLSKEVREWMGKLTEVKNKYKKDV